MLEGILTSETTNKKKNIKEAKNIALIGHWKENLLTVGEQKMHAGCLSFSRDSVHVHKWSEKHHEYWFWNYQKILKNKWIRKYKIGE